MKTATTTDIRNLIRSIGICANVYRIDSKIMRSDKTRRLHIHFSDNAYIDQAKLATTFALKLKDRGLVVDSMRTGINTDGNTMLVVYGLDLDTPKVNRYVSVSEVKTIVRTLLPIESTRVDGHGYYANPKMRNVHMNIQHSKYIATMPSIQTIIKDDIKTSLNARGLKFGRVDLRQTKTGNVRVSVWGAVAE